MKKFIFALIIFISYIGIAEAQVFNPISYNNKPDLNYYQHTASSIYAGTTSTGAAWTVNPLSAITLATFTIPGGSMGANGVMRIAFFFSNTNSSNNKTLTITYGSQNIKNNTRTTTAVDSGSYLFINRNSVSTNFYNIADGTTVFANGSSAVNTAIDQSFTVTGTTTLETGLTVTTGTGNGTTCTVTYNPHGYNSGEYIQAAGGSNCSTSGNPNADPVMVTRLSATQYTYPCSCNGNMVSTFPTTKRYSVIQLESVDINVKYNP